MTTHVRRLALPQARLDRINEIIQRKSPLPDARDFEVIEIITVEFSPSVCCDLEVCNGDPPYLDPVLFDDGCDVGVCEVRDAVEGEYVWHYRGNVYKLTVDADNVPDHCPATNEHGELVLFGSGGKQLCCGQRDDGSHGAYLSLRDREGSEITSWDEEGLVHDDDALGAAFNTALMPLAVALDWQRSQVRGQAYLKA